MRIAIISGNQGIVGGVEAYVAWLLKVLGARHELTFAFECAAASSARRVDEGATLRASIEFGGLSDSEFMQRLTELEPDLVFMQACERVELEWAVARRFRTVLYAHAYYATCATSWRLHRLPKLEVCSRRFGPACLAVNYLRGCGARNPVQLLRLYSKQRSRAEILPELSGLVVASTPMRELYLQHGVPAEKIRIIPPPPDVEPAEAPLPRTVAPTRVLFLGRLVWGKGPAHAIEATAQCQQRLGRALELTLAGDGPELAHCRALAEKLKLSARFVGWVDPAQRLELLRTSDLLVVPSIAAEPFGMVGVEAGSYGVPAVAYPTGGVVDWLRPGISGELALPGDLSSKALAIAMERALRDSEHHYQLRLGAHRVAREFTATQHLTKLESFFEELLAG